MLRYVPRRRGNNAGVFEGKEINEISVILEENSLIGERQRGGEKRWRGME